MSYDAGAMPRFFMWEEYKIITLMIKYSNYVLTYNAMRGMIISERR